MENQISMWVQLVAFIVKQIDNLHQGGCLHIAVLFDLAGLGRL